MSLPPKLDGMGIPVLSNDLTSKIINQERQYRPNINSMIRKSKIKLLSCSIKKSLKMMRQDIIEPQQQFESRTRNVKLANHLANKKGYDLTKQLFWNLLQMRNNRALSRLSSVCECGMKFDLTHDLSSKKHNRFVTNRDFQRR